RVSLDEIAPAISRRTKLAAVERTERSRSMIAATGIAEKIVGAALELDTRSVTGWIFSNELFDALPVHRVQMREGRLRELGVESGESGSRAWTSWPAPDVLSDYLARFGIGLAEGQLAEINLEAAPLYERLSRCLAAGRIVTFDYGHRARVLY